MEHVTHLKKILLLKQNKTLKILESYLYRLHYNFHLLALIPYCGSQVDIV